MNMRSMFKSVLEKAVSTATCELATYDAPIDSDQDMIEVISEWITDPMLSRFEKLGRLVVIDTSKVEQVIDGTRDIYYLPSVGEVFSKAVTLHGSEWLGFYKRVLRGLEPCSIKVTVVDKDGKTITEMTKPLTLS